MKARSLCIASVFFYVFGSLAAQPLCRVTVPIIAFDDRTDEPLGTLATSDFRASVRRNEMPIDALTTAPAARRIVFVFDRSGSMMDNSFNRYFSNEHPGAVASQSLSEAVSAVPDTDTVAFLVFAGKFSQHTEFMSAGSARAKLAEILAWRPAEKRRVNTPLWENIDSALKMFNTHRHGDAIVVISDGGNNSGKLKGTRLSDELVASGVPVFAILVAPQIDRIPEKERAMLNLIEFTESTGGTIAIKGQQPKSLNPTKRYPRGVSQLFRLLDHPLDLTVERPEVSKPEKWHLTLKDKELRKKATLLYPPYLAPCTSAQ